MYSLPVSKRNLLIGLLLALFILSLPTLLVSASAYHQGCEPPECYEPPGETPEPPSGGSPSGGGGSWSGYSDGRLNPDMAEYYSVWCAHDVIEVWGGIPSPQLISTIALVDVLLLGDVGLFDAGNGLTVSRTGDTVVISGSNGNGGGPGSKWFSLNECLTRNGSTPQLPEQPLPPQPPPNNPPPPEPTQDPVEDAEETVGLCLPGATSMAEFLGCINFFTPDEVSDDFLYTMIWAIATFCANGFVPLAVLALPTFHFWRRRRK